MTTEDKNVLLGFGRHLLDMADALEGMPCVSEEETGALWAAQDSVRYALRHIMRAVARASSTSHYGLGVRAGGCPRECVLDTTPSPLLKGDIQ